MYGRSSYTWRSAAGRLSLYSFPHRFPIHFLSVLHDAIPQTGNNMSLFFPSVILCCPLAFYFCCDICLPFFLLCFALFPCLWCKTLIIMTCPSAVAVLYFLFLSRLSSLQQSTSFHPVTARLSSMKMRCFKAKSVGVAASLRCTCDVQRHFFVFEVTLSWHQWSWSPEEITGSINSPASVSASFNELFKPSINQYFLIHFTSTPRVTLVFYMCCNYWSKGERCDMKARVQLPSMAASVRSIGSRSCSAGVSLSHFDVWACLW